jgi:hypothetical protein
MKHQACQLNSDSRIAVIGGGPGGSFFALYRRHFAGLPGMRPEITVYQDRDCD